MKVYFIDDEEWLISELKGILDWGQYNFEICGYSTDPFVAQEEILRLQPDLVISDIYMDGMNGLQLAQNVRSQNKNTVFCFLSAYDNFEYAVSALKLGAIDYLTKPINVQELISVLEKFTQSKEKKVGAADETLADNSIINSIVKEIQLSHATDQSLSAYAKRYGYNASYLSSLFKKEMGVSFIEYVIQYRINKAKELLVSSNQPIGLIAYQVGYNEYYHFAKAFKKNVGVSPTEYRERYKRQD